MNKLLYTVAEATELLNIGKTSLYQLMASGSLKVIKIGRSTRISAQELQRFVRDAERGADDFTNFDPGTRKGSRDGVQAAIERLAGVEAGGFEEYMKTAKHEILK
jgi:excisionase family DNA binding protein